MYLKILIRFLLLSVPVYCVGYNRFEVLAVFTLKIKGRKFPILLWYNKVIFTFNAAAVRIESDQILIFSAACYRLSVLQEDKCICLKRQETRQGKELYHLIDLISAIDLVICLCSAVAFMFSLVKR